MSSSSVPGPLEWCLGLEALRNNPIVVSLTPCASGGSGHTGPRTDLPACGHVSAEVGQDSAPLWSLTSACVPTNKQTPFFSPTEIWQGGGGIPNRTSGPCLFFPAGFKAFPASHLGAETLRGKRPGCEHERYGHCHLRPAL